MKHLRVLLGSLGIHMRIEEFRKGFMKKEELEIRLKRWGRFCRAPVNKIGYCRSDIHRIVTSRESREAGKA